MLTPCSKTVEKGRLARRVPPRGATAIAAQELGRPHGALARGLQRQQFEAPVPQPQNNRPSTPSTPGRDVHRPGRPRRRRVQSGPP